MKPGLGQGLIDARLIGAERAAPLQQQRDAVEGEPRGAGSGPCPRSLRAISGRAVFPPGACRARPDRAMPSSTCSPPSSPIVISFGV
jgi:hypothetical protein